MTQHEHALIVAGGKGSRFGHSLPKQFVELNGVPVLMHTLNAFYQYAADINVVLVLPEDEIPTWNHLAAKHGFRKPVVIRAGGATRFDSVKRGLQDIPDDGWVAIHDGVRPLVTPDIIAASFRHAREHGCAVAALHLKESVRMLLSEPENASFPFRHTKAVDRSRYKIVQTPQTFRASLIRSAYEKCTDASATDDATVVEQAGHPVFLFEGSYENIKITTPEDLSVAAALQRRRGESQHRQGR